MKLLVSFTLALVSAATVGAADLPLVDGVSGAPLTWSSWLAKRGPVAVMVWASWAPEANEVIASYKAFAEASRKAGLHPVLLDVQESLGDGRKALAGSGINWIHDRHGGFLKLYRVITVPSVIVISADGEVLQRLKTTPEALKTGVIP